MSEVVVQQGGGRMGSGRWRGYAEAAGWWAGLLALYLVLVSPLTGGEVLLGAVLSAIGSAAAVAARRVIGLPLHGFRGSGRALLWVPVAVLADTVLLARLLVPELLRRGAPAGGWRTVGPAGADRPGRPDQPAGADGESWQAVAGLLLSLSPGSYVVDSGTAPPTVRLHVLRDEPNPVERAVRR